MIQPYRRIQKLLLARIRDHYGLSESEALLILDDVVLNLEAMAADLARPLDAPADPVTSPQRILPALRALGEQLECTVLTEIETALFDTGVIEGRPLPADAIEPLTHFVHGLRKAMPPLSRSYGV